MMKYLAIGHSKAKLEFAAGTNFTSDDDPAEIFPFSTSDDADQSPRKQALRDVISRC
jgi:hypothetical protein